MNEDAYRELSRQNTKSVYNKKKLSKEVHDRLTLKTFVKEKKSLRKFAVHRLLADQNESKCSKDLCKRINNRLKNLLFIDCSQIKMNRDARKIFIKELTIV